LGGLLLFFASYIPQIQTEFNFRDFLDKDDPDLAFFETLEKELDFENEILLIGIQHHPSIFNTKFLSELEAFTNKCGQLELVDRAYSIGTLNDFVKSPLGPMTFPFIHIEKPSLYSRDSIKISKDERLMNWLVSKDFTAVSVIVHAKKNLSIDLQEQLITSLDSLTAHSSFDDIHLAGIMNSEITHIRMIGKELGINTIICCLIIVLSLIVIFRSVVGVVIPAVTVLSSMVIFLGGIVFFNRNINLLSTIFPTIIMVVGISDIIHFLTKYHHYLKMNESRYQAIRLSFKELIVPMTITSLTTAIGFWSLLSSKVVPIRDFGVEAGIGVVLTLVITILFVPAVLSRINTNRFTIKKTNDRNWVLLFDKINKMTNKHGKTILLITVLIVVISIVGIFRVNENYRVIENFSKHSKITKDLFFFENNLSGVRSLKLAVLPNGGRKVNEIVVLNEIDKLHNYLKSLPEIGVVFSPVSYYKTMNKAYNRGATNFYRLPENDMEIKTLDNYFKSKKNSYFRSSDNENQVGIISVQLPDIGSQQMEQMNAMIMKWIAKNLNSEILSFRLTGISFLSDKSNNSLKSNMMLSLLFAFAMVSILMALLYRNIKLLIISLVPNIIPLVIAGGVMGFTGLIFNASTAVVFTIGFVVAVDDTIHFLSRFQIERRQAVTIDDAISLTFTKTGKAIIITSLILLLGFLVLFRSLLTGVFAQGVLFSTIIVSALFADLFLLPVMLRKMLKV